MHDSETGRLNDSLDREIEQMLAVQPSPEYVASVRQRVQSSSRPSSSWPWRWQSAGVAAVALLTVVLWHAVAPETERAGSVSHADADSSAMAGDTPAPARRGPDASEAIVQRPPKPAGKRADATRSVSATARPRRSEIVIDVNEAAAFERFVETMRSPELLVGGGDQVLVDAMVLPVPSQVTVPAIEIAPVELRSQEGEE